MTGVEHTPAVTAFFDELSTLMLAGDPRLTRLGTDEDARAAFERAARTAHRIVWNMQPAVTLRAVLDGSALNARSRARGADLRLVVPEHVVRRSPLLSSVTHPLRVGAVPRPMLVVDDSVFLGGPLGTRLAHTLWQTADPELGAQARGVFQVVWDAADPAEEVGDRPALPGRTLQVAIRLLDGASDKAIAADLAISERTVSAEVQRIVAWVDARSRGHAIALLAGAGR